MSGIAGSGCERIIPEEERKTLQEIERSIVYTQIWDTYFLLPPINTRYIAALSICECQFQKKNIILYDITIQLSVFYIQLQIQ